MVVVIFPLPYCLNISESVGLLEDMSSVLCTCSCVLVIQSILDLSTSSLSLNMSGLSLANGSPRGSPVPSRNSVAASSPVPPAVVTPSSPSPQPQAVPPPLVNI